MHKLFMLLAAVAFVHVARSQDNSTAPAAPTGTETCSASVNGVQQTLQPGDRYCLDDTTPRVCGFGEWYDQKCPEGFKCFDLDKCPNGPDGTTCQKPSKPFQVQCYQINRAPAYATGPPQGADNQARLRRQSTTKSCSATINGVQQTLQPGDRYCVDETKHRVCAYGEWYDQECDAGTKCYDLDKCPIGPDGTTCDKPPQPFQVQCYKYNKAIRPGSDNHRNRRQANETSNEVAAPAAPATETCSADSKTFQSGDRYCLDETTPRVCGYGVWYDQKCPDGFKCFELDKCPNGPDGTTCQKPPKPNLVMCYQYNKAAPYPTGPPPGADNHRRRRQANETAPVAPPTAETCSASVNGVQQTLQPGDRYCLDETTPRVCGFGEFYDQKCPEGFKCFDLDKCPNGPDGTTCQKPSKPFQVQCYQINRGPGFATGPPAGADEHRRRRQANETAPAAPAATGSESCSATIDGQQQTLQSGDRYCVDETKHRVCAYGEWYDQECDAGFKCFQLDKCPNGPDGTTCQKPSKPWQVQCFKLTKGAAAPSGPPTGQDKETLRLLRRRR